MADLIDLGLGGILTFSAVFLAYWLALREDRAREKRESETKRNDLLNLFRFDLHRLHESLVPESGAREKVYSDAWDSAKATGNLSTLKPEEMQVLSEIYLQVRRVNDIIDDPHTIGITAPFDALKAITVKRDLLVKIEAAERKFAWLKTIAKSQ